MDIVLHRRGGADQPDMVGVMKDDPLAPLMIGMLIGAFASLVCLIAWWA